MTTVCGRFLVGLNQVLYKDWLPYAWGKDDVVTTQGDENSPNVLACMSQDHGSRHVPTPNDIVQDTHITQPASR